MDNNSNIDLIAKFRKIAIQIKYKHENRKLLAEGIEKYKKENIIPSNYNISKIPSDNSIRWNSTYYIIKTTLELKSALKYIANNTLNRNYKLYILNDFE